MGWLDIDKLLEIPLRGPDSKRAAQLIQMIIKISAKGGGFIPPGQIVPLLGLPGPMAKRIAKSRGDLRLVCPGGPQGKFQGTFLNKGDPVRETIPHLQEFELEMFSGKKIWGRYQLGKNTLQMYQVDGLKVKKKLTQEMELEYRVEQITLTPQSIAVF